MHVTIYQVPKYQYKNFNIKLSINIKRLISNPIKALSFNTKMPMSEYQINNIKLFELNCQYQYQIVKTIKPI